MSVLKYKDPVTGEVKKVGAPALETPVFVYEGVIATAWTEDETTGAKWQNVAIPGVTAKHTAKLDHAYSGNYTAESYATFVDEENQFLTYITNGFAETYDGGIKFVIFGDAPTIPIPIVVEVV